MSAPAVPLILCRSDEYHSAAAIFGTLAQDAATTHIALLGVLDSGAGMAGSDSIGQSWAASYNEAAGLALSASERLITASSTTADLITTGAHNHETGEATASFGNAAPPPAPAEWPVPCVATRAASAAMAQDWRAVMNAVLYGIQFSKVLGPEEVDRISTGLLANPLWNLTPDDEYQALSAALDSGEKLDNFVGTGHSESELRDFFQAVVGELDGRRPWPPAGFQQLPLTEIGQFTDNEPIARIDVPWPAINGPLRRMLEKPEGATDTGCCCDCDPAPRSHWCGLDGRANPRPR